MLCHPYYFDILGQGSLYTILVNSGLKNFTTEKKSTTNLCVEKIDNFYKEKMEK